MHNTVQKCKQKRVLNFWTEILNLNWNLTRIAFSDNIFHLLLYMVMLCNLLLSFYFFFNMYIFCARATEWWRLCAIAGISEPLWHVKDLVSCMCNSQIYLHFHFVSFICSLCILILLDFPHLLCFMRLYIFWKFLTYCKFPKGAYSLNEVFQTYVRINICSINQLFLLFIHRFLW